MQKELQKEYKYNGTKECIIAQTLNSSGVRDISRNLKINRNTVLAVLKNPPATENNCGRCFFNRKF
ncbi:MAG: hypothetical protein LBN23_03180 [Paludibacter sp.]|jgi:transposase-like protein|nr:hypothetical protein [Paludibacter sp.]